MIKVMARPAGLVDARHMIEPEKALKAGFIYIGLGAKPFS